MDNEPLPDDPRRRRHGNVKTWGQHIVENGHPAGEPDTDAAAGDAAPDAGNDAPDSNRHYYSE